MNSAEDTRSPEKAGEKSGNSRTVGSSTLRRQVESYSATARIGTTDIDTADIGTADISLANHIRETVGRPTFTRLSLSVWLLPNGLSEPEKSCGVPPEKVRVSRGSPHVWK